MLPSAFKGLIVNILLTGATGFIGHKLVDYLLQYTKANLRLAVRTTSDYTPTSRISVVHISSLSDKIDWQESLKDCDIVIHAAARVHVMHEMERDPLTAFREINVTGTLNLACQAAKAGARRFIFLSSIKVNGESSRSNQPFREKDIEAPTAPYAISKYEAEKSLLLLAQETGMEVVIIRPVLVYGVGVKGNFQYMLRWLKKGLPLPLALIRNKRSYLSVENLVDFVLTCIGHPNAANQIFLLSDDHDLSVPELLQKLSLVLNKKLLLLPVPIWLLKYLANMVGKQEVVLRLCESLQVDISKAKEMLDWHPKTHIDDALRRAVEG